MPLLRGEERPTHLECVCCVCAVDAGGVTGPQKRAEEGPGLRKKLYCTNKQSLGNHFKTLTIISQRLVVEKRGGKKRERNSVLY